MKMYSIISSLFYKTYCSEILLQLIFLKIFKSLLSFYQYDLKQIIL